MRLFSPLNLFETEKGTNTTDSTRRINNQHNKWAVFILSDINEHYILLRILATEYEVIGSLTYIIGTHSKADPQRMKFECLKMWSYGQPIWFFRGTHVFNSKGPVFQQLHAHLIALYKVIRYSIQFVTSIFKFNVDPAKMPRSYKTGYGCICI